jgi:hypothetical protein
VSGPTHDRAALRARRLRLRDSHPLRRPVPAAFGSRRARGEGAAAPSPRLVQPRNRIAGRLCRDRGLGSSPFARRYSGNPLSSSGYSDVSLPPVPPRHQRVPDRASGGLPHSDTPGSQAASASPGRFAAWPRPSSAADAKASTVRPSRGVLIPFTSDTRRLANAGPARASGTHPDRHHTTPTRRTAAARTSQARTLRPDHRAAAFRLGMQDNS